MKVALNTIQIGRYWENTREISLISTPEKCLKILKIPTFLQLIIKKSYKVSNFPPSMFIWTYTFVEFHITISNYKNPQLSPR